VPGDHWARITRAATDSRCARPASPSWPGTSPGAPDKRGPERPPGKDEQAVDGRATRLYGDRRTNCTTGNVQLSRYRQHVHTRLGPAAWGARTQRILLPCGGGVRMAGAPFPP